MKTESISMEDWRIRGWTLSSINIPAVDETWRYRQISEEEDLTDALETKRKYDLCGASSFLRRSDIIWCGGHFLVAGLRRKSYTFPATFRGVGRGQIS